MNNDNSIDLVGIIRYLLAAIIGLLLYVYRGIVTRIRDLERAVFPERRDPKDKHRR